MITNTTCAYLDHTASEVSPKLRKSLGDGKRQADSDNDEERGPKRVKKSGTPRSYPQHNSSSDSSSDQEQDEGKKSSKQHKQRRGHKGSSNDEGGGGLKSHSSSKKALQKFATDFCESSTKSHSESLQEFIKDYSSGLSDLNQTEIVGLKKELKDSQAANTKNAGSFDLAQTEIANLKKELMDSKAANSKIEETNANLKVKNQDLITQMIRIQAEVKLKSAKWADDLFEDPGKGESDLGKGAKGGAASVG